MAAKKKAKKKPYSCSPEAAQNRLHEAHNKARFQRDQRRIQRERALTNAQWHEKFEFLKSGDIQQVTKDEIERLRMVGSAFAVVHLTDVVLGLVPDTTPAQRLDAAKQLRTGKAGEIGTGQGQSDDDPEEMRRILQEAERRKAGTARDLE